MIQYFLVGQTVSYIKKKFILYVNKSILPFPQVSNILKLKKTQPFRKSVRRIYIFINGKP